MIKVLFSDILIVSRFFFMNFISNLQYFYSEICKEVCEKVVKQNERCQTLYNKAGDDLELLTHRSSTCPSVVEMLEWLQDTETLMMRQYPLQIRTDVKG